MLYQKSLITKAGDALNQSIHFIGPSDEPETWFNIADIFGFCPINEGMPNVMLEAMSSGTPVVTTSFIGLSNELGEDGKHYLLANDSATSMAAKFRDLLDNDELRNQLSKQSQIWTRRHHSIEVTLDSLSNIYRGQMQ